MKMKKLVALITAGALCLGMSMTAFAADAVNPSNGDGDGSTNQNPNPPVSDQTYQEWLNENNAGQAEIPIYSTATDKVAGVKADVLSDALEKGELTDKQYEEVKKVLEDDKEILEKIKEVYNVPNGATIGVLGVGNLTYGKYDEKTGEWVDLEVPAGGIDQQIFVGYGSEEGLKDGDKIYVLHYNPKTSEWEVLEGTVNMVNDAAYVKVHFDSLSPVAFVKVMSSGKVVALDKKGEPVTKTTSKSPKTGEF